MGKQKKLANSDENCYTAFFHLRELQNFAHWQPPAPLTLKILYRWTNWVRTACLGQAFPDEWQPQVLARPTLSWFERQFGRMTQTHAFYYRSGVFGFPVYEPHLTRTLAAFMRSQHAGTRRARQRARGFLAAVNKATAGGLLCRGGDAASLAQSFPSEGTPIHVVDEKRFDDSGERLDLYFRWNLAGETYALGIECKFGGYQPAANQLKTYESLLDAEEVRFFRLVMTTTPVEDEQLRAGWPNLLWLEFCRIWESEVAEQMDTDEDFARFRRALWKTALRG